LEEILAFVTKYFHEFQHMSQKAWDAKEIIFGEVLEGDPIKVVLTPVL
jgi:hypothetical protein